MTSEEFALALSDNGHSGWAFIIFLTPYVFKFVMFLLFIELCFNVDKIRRILEKEK